MVCLHVVCVALAGTAATTHAADHLLAPAHTAGPILKLFDPHRPQTVSTATTEVVSTAPLHGTACQAGYACVMCLANCPAGGTPIIQQLYVRSSPPPGTVAPIDLSIFRPGQ